MKNLLFASTALAVIATGAQAQEPAYDWSGFYVGAQAGYGWSNVDVEYDGDEFESSDDGFIGGLHVGYDWQRQDFVYGLLADFDIVDHEIDQDLSGKLENYTYDVDWVATARARAGFTMDRTLFFGSGGIALAHIDASIAIDGPVIEGSDQSSGVELGGVFGLGVEHAFAGNWTAKAEYVHYMFEDLDLNVEGESVTFDPSFGAIKFGVSYRF